MDSKSAMPVPLSYCTMWFHRILKCPVSRKTFFPNVIGFCETFFYIPEMVINMSVYIVFIFIVK